MWAPGPTATRLGIGGFYLVTATSGVWIGLLAAGEIAIGGWDLVRPGASAHVTGHAT